MGKYHNILYIALKVAWNWGIKDSDVVCSLLSKSILLFQSVCWAFNPIACSFADEIYECERTFERLFLGAIFGTNAPYFIAGWRSDFKDQDENARAAVFFLHHACQQNLRFVTREGHSVP